MQKTFEELYQALDKIIDVRTLLPNVVRVLVMHKDMVLAWLESQEFKEKYINHPYPPLLNPATINYDGIPAEFAWELNLPLPPYFDFLFVAGHGAGGSGFHRFLEHCGCSGFYYGGIEDARAAYVSIYQQILKNALNKNSKQKRTYLMIPDYVIRGDYKKYFALVPKKPAINLVRDPISILRSHLGIKRLAGGGGIFSLTCEPRSVIDARTGYGFVREQTSTPTLDEIPFWINYLPLCYHDTQLISALINVDSITYVDMQEILGDVAFDTMCALAQKFDWIMPKESEREFYTRRVADFGLGFPFKLYAHPSDIEKLQNGFTNDYSSCQLQGGIPLTITTCYQIEEGQTDITAAFFKESISPLVITATAQECRNLLQNPQLAQVCSAYLKAFVQAVFAKKDAENAKRLKEEAILEYFKQKPFFREKFKKILESHLAHLQQHRPDIIKGWKYYTQFLEICKENSKK